MLGPEYSVTINTLVSGTNVFFSDWAVDAGYAVKKQESDCSAMPALPQEGASYGYLDHNEPVVEALRAGRDASGDLRDGLDVAEFAATSYLAAERGERLNLKGTDLERYVPEPARAENRSRPRGTLEIHLATRGSSILSTSICG